MDLYNVSRVFSSLEMKVSILSIHTVGLFARFTIFAICISNVASQKVLLLGLYRYVLTIRGQVACIEVGSMVFAISHQFKFVCIETHIGIFTPFIYFVLVTLEVLAVWRVLISLCILVSSANELCLWGYARSGTIRK